jgi:hypothetical protein
MVKSSSMPAGCVLVPEAHALGMLAAIRSLGRAGYRVLAASPKSEAIGFVSRYCAARTLCPRFDTPDYVEWLRHYIVRHAVSTIVPGGAFLLAIEPWFEEFQPLLPIAPHRHIVYRAFSKTEVFEAFRTAPAELRLLDHHPPALVVASNGPQPSARRLADLGATLYLKADARHGGFGTDDLLVGPLTPSQAGEALQQALRTYRQVLLQGVVTGRQAGVTLLMDETGRVLAQNSFRDVHDEPTRRGTMSLRRIWKNPALLDDATRRLRYLGWQGAAMLEYRVRDSDGSFNFIELNPRYWQSLHLDLLAGIDFPRLQMAWFEGQNVLPPPPPRNIVCGDLWPGEISRMLEIWRSERFSRRQRSRESLAFLLRLLDPRIASDYTFPGDRMLYWRRVAQVIRGWVRPRT